MASYDKIIKYVVQSIQTALSPLIAITKNQEIIIAQNQQIIDLLGQNRQTVENSPVLVNSDESIE